MLIKGRTKSTTHLILESLNNRMVLSFEEKMGYRNQVKGFEGELLFDQYLNSSEQSGLVVNDLLLSTKNTSYQMDSILIFNKQLHIYEVKNYTGAYTLKDGTLFAETGHSIQNPIDQVNRKKSYLNNLLLNRGYQYEISSYVAFINPNFLVYSLPPTESILFYGQLEDHFKQLTHKMKAHTTSHQDKKLANYLLNQHQEVYRPNHLPNYSIQDLKKGIICPKCSSFEFTKTRQNRVCATCGYKEKIADAIYRSVLEFQLLFPEIPINVPNIYIWCGGCFTDYNVRSVLNKYFTLHLKGPKSFYT